MAVAYGNGQIARAATATGKIEVLYPARPGGAARVAFSPDDGKQLAAIGGPYLRLWPADPWPYIRSRLPRALSAGERERFGLDAPRADRKSRPEAVAPGPRGPDE